MLYYGIITCLSVTYSKHLIVYYEQVYSVCNRIIRFLSLSVIGSTHDYKLDIQLLICL